MKIRITSHVPGYVNFQRLGKGAEHDLDPVTAGSLIADGYAVAVEAEVERSTPAERRETRPGRPRKGG